MSPRFGRIGGMVLCLWLAAAAAGLTSGCARTLLTATVLRPAEMDLTGKARVAVGEFKGRGGREVAAHLAEVLRANALVDLVEGPPEGVPAGGPAVLVLQGEVLEYDLVWREQDWMDICESRFPLVFGLRQEYVCMVYERSAEARVRVSLEVLDRAAEKVLFTKEAAGEARQEVRSVNNPPRPIDGERLLAGCTRRVALEAVRAVSPWPDTVEVALYRDGALPGLAEGIGHARAGRW
ncbi:MAG: hypothetical protein AB1896_21700, partial [Thermodesulfobacteriota bacterium]